MCALLRHTFKYVNDITSFNTKRENKNKRKVKSKTVGSCTIKLGTVTS